MSQIEIKVDENLAGMRLDLALLKADIGLSRRRIRAVIDVGGTYVNRKRVRIASRQVEAGDRIELNFDQQSLSLAKRQRFELADQHIIYEDGDLVAINKPPGLLAQASRKQAVDNVLTCLKAYYKKRGATPELHLVHRLDAETTGVMLVAKNLKAADWIMDLLRQRKVQKIYHAICHGVSQEAKFTVSCNLSAINPMGKVRVVTTGGKSSLTHFQMIDCNRQLPVSLMECRPVTGRSHQLRVHLDARRLPIIGDKKYGDVRKALPENLASLARQYHMLHAKVISFQKPFSEEVIKITASYPENFQTFLSAAGLHP